MRYLNLSSKALHISIYMCLLLFSKLATAQETNTSLSPFLFDEFKDGLIINQSGKILESKLNYNTFKGKMFIAKNDFQFAISNNIKVDSVKIQGRIFVPFEEIYLELLLNDSIALYKQHQTKLNELGVTVGYDQTMKTSSSTSIDFTNNPNSIDGIPKGFELVDATHYRIFFQGKTHVVNTKKQLLKIFPMMKEELKTFIKKNKFNIETDADVVKIVEFCNHASIKPN